LITNKKEELIDQLLLDHRDCRSYLDVKIENKTGRYIALHGEFNIDERDSLTKAQFLHVDFNSVDFTTFV